MSFILFLSDLVLLEKVSMKVGFENFVDFASPPDFGFVIRTQARLQYSFLSRLVFQFGEVGLGRVSMNLGNLV